ncbi:MAG: hypothetical protein AAGD06_10950 [Acidobacteriota bacterium]
MTPLDAPRRFPSPSPRWLAAPFVALLAVASAAPAAAQAPAADSSEDPSGVPTIVVEGRGRSQVRIAFPAADLDPGLTGDFLQGAREIEQTLRDDLDQTILFNAQGPTELGVLALTGNREQDFDQYRSLGNEVVLLTAIKREGERLVLDGWVYDLPSKQSVLGKRYRGTLDQVRLIAHYLTDALHHQFTGRPSLALTSLSFQSDRDGYQELYLMDYDGHNQRRISGHRSTSGYSDWSPTGDAIAYMSYFAGPPGIYYVDLASGDKIPVYRDGVLNLSPSFSPDGRRIAFASSKASNIDIYACDRSCSQPSRLTRSNAIDTNPAWSPDGKQIAFTSSRSGRPNIYVMNADGSNIRRISFEGDYNEGANWRPDGTQLTYASRRGTRFRVAVTNLVDLQTQFLTDGPDSYEEPTFSPDGSKIAFTLRKGQESKIFVMDANGGNWRQLTHEGNSSAPDWSSHPKK